MTTAILKNGVTVTPYTLYGVTVTPYIYFKDTLLMSFEHPQLVCWNVEIQEHNMCTPLWDILYMYVCTSDVYHENFSYHISWVLIFKI